MEFRPCIDIHNGKVKQIVGSTLTDEKDFAKENFVSKRNAAYYAGLYKRHQLKGGHIILLNGADSPYFEKTKAEALSALKTYPGGMQVGGGIHAENAGEYLDAGASHVIVTSYVFRDGEIRKECLEALKKAVGKERVVLDLSVRKFPDGYYVMTDRWQRKSNVRVDEALLVELSAYCGEYLVHAVDVEGKNGGIESQLVELLSGFCGLPVTYAGGIHSYKDLELMKRLGQGRIHITVGSALDLFGGKLEFQKICELCKP